MTIRLYMFILMIIFLTSGLSVTLLLFYMNPLSNPELSLILLSIGVFLFASSLLSPIIFFMKKIYYRGDVSIFTMNASVRQSILLVLGGVLFFWLYLYRISDRNILLIIVATIACIEIMFQVLD